MVSQMKRPVASTLPDFSFHIGRELCCFWLRSRESLQDPWSCSSTGMGKRPLGIGCRAPFDAWRGSRCLVISIPCDPPPPRIYRLGLQKPIKRGHNLYDYVPDIHPCVPGVVVSHACICHP